jgi:hypothetical protein
MKLDNINSDIFRTDRSSATSAGSGSSICTEGYAIINTGTNIYKIENPLFKFDSSEETEANFKPKGSLFSYFTKGDVIAANNFGNSGTQEGVDIGFVDMGLVRNSNLKIKLYNNKDEEFSFFTYKNMPLGICNTVGRTANNTFRLNAGEDITNGVEAIYTMLNRSSSGKLVPDIARPITVNKITNMPG